MPRNVLVVDDSAAMRKVVIRCLEMVGLELNEVHEAANGREGLEVLDRHWVDLLLVDLNMPVMDGEAMILELRQRPEGQGLPVVVISTEGSRPRIARLEAQGVRFIHKPFSPLVVRETLQAIPGLLAP